MASYSFPSPGYVNIPPYYNTASNGYSALNFQYTLPDCKREMSILQFHSPRCISSSSIAYSSTGAGAASGLTSSSAYGTQPVGRLAESWRSVDRCFSSQGLEASYYHQFQPSLGYPCYSPAGYPSAYNLNASTPSSNQLTASIKSSQGYQLESLPPTILDHQNQYSTPSVLSSPNSPSPSIKTETSARCKEPACSNVVHRFSFS